MHVTTLGIDLAKNTFQLYGVDEDGSQVLSKRLSRERFIEFMYQLPVCRIAMESCGGAHHFARLFKDLGHEVVLIAPKFVKGFLLGEKNDRNDAKAICRASLSMDMRYVPIKAVEQQDIQSIHRHRELLVKQRTQVVNQIRGLLSEYGVIIPKQIRYVRQHLVGIVEDETNELSAMTRELFSDMYAELRRFDERIKVYDKKIDAIAASYPSCTNLMTIPGVGPKTATALYSAVGYAHEFKHGRQFAAWCGLVPRQSSSGEKIRLGGINKRGNRYLRTLLVHGARSVIRCMNKTPDKPLSDWALRKCARSSTNRTVVAIANKNARVAWVMLSQGVCYDEAFVCSRGNV